MTLPTTTFISNNSHNQTIPDAHRVYSREQLLALRANAVVHAEVFNNIHQIQLRNYFDCSLK